MHLEILNKNQVELTPMIKSFKREFYMVGVTAIALHIGHRLSIDFDMFKETAFSPKKNLTKLDSFKQSYRVTLNIENQLNLICNEVKLTFFSFPHTIEHPIKVNDFISIPTLLDLAAMKAFALGRRSKWKDYLDLYFIIKSHYGIKEISERASTIFGLLFTEKLFRSQISYFEGVNYSENVEFMPGFEVDEQIVKDFLIEKALEI